MPELARHTSGPCGLGPECLIWKSGAGAPAWNMAADEVLLESSTVRALPVLRLYAWAEPAGTFGYFQKYDEVASWTPLRPLIRRPTGGGLVPHARDWTYTLVFPPGHPWFRLRAEASYEQVHRWVARALAQLRLAASLFEQPVPGGPGQCFIGAEKFDVLAAGRKVAGAAQKRNKLGLLIQGSVQPEPGWARADWENALLQTAAADWQTVWHPFLPSHDFFDRCTILAREKYATAAYNEGRVTAITNR